MVLDINLQKADSRTVELVKELLSLGAFENEEHRIAWPDNLTDKMIPILDKYANEKQR